MGRRCWSSTAPIEAATASHSSQRGHRPAAPEDGEVTGAVRQAADSNSTSTSSGGGGREDSSRVAPPILARLRLCRPCRLPLAESPGSLLRLALDNLKLRMEAASLARRESSVDPRSADGGFLRVSAPTGLPRHSTHYSLNEKSFTCPHALFDSRCRDLDVSIRKLVTPACPLGCTVGRIGRQGTTTCAER